ncbi:asparaginase [Paenibacillus pini]|uniref:Atypical L-asparaginase n=1 Tax=Paenibacillus pini JCM 16418 TaxID=1236976 RepID=W7YTJ2_9BACL|nr:asparaginase [Paenibacillus pini]GAF10508.1 atypical L-asparaginase [Paenibacillus pini JCM 16418]
MDKVLVQEYRADIMECAHHGHICIVNDKGDVQAYTGDPHFVTFTRSAAKPLQAIPGIRAGIAAHYGLTEQEIAIMTASHLAEPEHVKVLESIQKKIKSDDHVLVCAASYPLDEESKENLLRQQGHKRRLYHNCSGKHLGVLAYSEMKGYSAQDYAKPDHPVQQEIIELVSNMCDIETQHIELGTDGCGFPVFAIPLSAMATAYMKLACPDLISDDATRSAVQTITAAMNHFPEMVGGRGRVDSLILKDTNIVAKGGFKGVYCFGLKKERLGVAFKILDGSEEEWAWIVQSILEQIGYEHRDTIEQLKLHFSTEIYNDGGQQVGYAKPVFQLQS